MLYIGILNLFQHVLSIENRFEILIREYINFRLKKKTKKIYKIIFIFDSIYKSHVFYKLQCKKKTIIIITNLTTLKIIRNLAVHL